MIPTPLVGFLLLQTVWVVDDDGGPGVNFTDIQPAIDAAADGDVLEVRAGIYAPFSMVGKGLTILGSDPSTTRVRGGVFSDSFVSDVPAGSVAWLERLGFEAVISSTFAVQTLHVSGAQTRAVLSEVIIPPQLGSAGGDPALHVNGAEVHLHGCALTGDRGAGITNPNVLPGGAAVRVENAGRVHAAASVLTGGAGGSGVTLPLSNFHASAGGPGVWASGSGSSPSWVWMVDTIVQGGTGGWDVNGSDSRPGGPGIRANSSMIRLSGGALVQGGDSGQNGSGFCPLATGGPAIVTEGSAEVRNHGVSLVGGTSCTGQVAPTVSGPGLVFAQPPLPALSLTGDPSLATGTLTLSLSGGPPAAAFGILLDDSPAFFGIPGPFLGEFLLAPPSVLFVFGTLSPTGGFGLTIPLSGLPPSLAYVPFHLQAAALDGGGTWRLANSVAAILRP